MVNGCRALKDSLTDNDVKGFIKVVVCAKSDKVLGIHLVGPEVAEILQVGVIVRLAFALLPVCGVLPMHGFVLTLNCPFVHPSSSPVAPLLKNPLTPLSQQRGGGGGRGGGRPPAGALPGRGLGSRGR